MNEWLSPASVLSTTAIIVAVIGLGYTRKVDKRQAKAEEPTISVDLEQTKWPGWYRIIIVVRNRTDAIWLMETIEARQPALARLGLEHELVDDFPVGGKYTPSRTDAVAGPLSLQCRVRPGHGDAPGTLTLHLLLSTEGGLGSESVCLRLSLRSLAEIRQIKMAVQRRATA